MVIQLNTVDKYQLAIKLKIVVSYILGLNGNLQFTFHARIAAIANTS